MLNAILRVIVLIFILIFVTVFAVVGVRWMGLQQTFQAPPHPWFEREFWAVYTPSAEEICAAKDLDQSPGENWIVQLPVKRQGETWVIPCAQPVMLKDFLAHSARHDFMLNVLAHDTWSLDELVTDVGAFDNSKHFAVRTEAQKVAAYLRKKAPQWLFAADAASLLRLRTFTSMYIESAIDFWPDFAIADFHNPEYPQIDQRMAAELQRRKKRVLLRWQETDTQEPAIPIQGIMTDRPSAAQQKWGKRL